jgi:hypothetical protein
VGAFGGRGGLRIGQVRRDRGQRGVLANGQVLRVGTAGGVVVPEHPVTDGEGRHGRADGCDLSSELIAQDRHPWPHQPGEDPDEERLGPPDAAVGAVHRRRVDIDEHLVVRCRRRRHIHHAHHVRRAVPSVHRGLHACTVAAGELRGDCGPAVRNTTRLGKTAETAERWRRDPNEQAKLNRP